MVGAKIGPQQGWSSLHDAAKEDDLDLMICIVEGKMGLPIRDIDLPSESGLTPLHVAALSGSNLCIAYLLGQGCDVELRDNLGRTALHWAADSGHVESMMHLIAAGQDLDELDFAGAAPLHLAARAGMTQACKYLVSVGADLKLKNGRGWSPIETATVPIYRATLESLEQSVVLINRIRRQHDDNELLVALTGCGMERFMPLFKASKYSYHHVFLSSRPVSMKQLNSTTEDKNDQMNIRDYMLFVENLQMHQGVKRSNPFAEAAKQQKFWDAHPEEFDEFLRQNPGYDAAEQDDSVYARPVFEKEREYVTFMRDTVLKELRQADKRELFADMRRTQQQAIQSADGRMECDDQEMEFDKIESCDTVDHGWPDVEILDYKQMEKNINACMYQHWEEFCLDFLNMVVNVMIYCRAVKSDLAESYKHAVAVGARGVRIFRKHRTSLCKFEAAMREERRNEAENHRTKWTKWVTEKRVRGMLPDRFKEVSGEAEQLEDKDFLERYTERFAKLQDAQEHWGNNMPNMFEVVRVGWEEDIRSRRFHGQLRWMLDLTSSRDVERHLQHSAEDVRSDMHKPGGDLPGPFTVDAFLRDIVWPMDFDLMRNRLEQEWDFDYYKKRPNDYRVMEQVEMDWLISQMNIISFHHKSHEMVKTILRVPQQPRQMIPKAPYNVIAAPGYPDESSVKVWWSQPSPKPSEVVVHYRLTLSTELEQPVEVHRTGCRPGEVIELLISSDDVSYHDIKLQNLQGLVNTGASWQGGTCLIEDLHPKTAYTVFVQAMVEGGVYGACSAPLLRFTTLSSQPHAPTGLHVLDVNDNAGVVQWEAPPDNGSSIIDYEVEYTDLKFQRSFGGRTGWHDTSFSTKRINDSTTGKDPLIPEPMVAGLSGLIAPATRLEMRVRARNEAGTGAWSKIISYQTKSRPASAPQALSLVATSFEHLDIAWMPPVASNSSTGIEAFQIHIEIQHSRTGEIETRYENVSIQELNRESLERGYSDRPPTSTRRSTPGSHPTSLSSSRPGTRGLLASRQGSRQGSRPSSQLGTRTASMGRAGDSSRPGTREGGLRTISDELKVFAEGESSEDDDKEVDIDEIDLGGTRSKTMANPAEWWRTTEFNGSIWYHDEAPRQVILKASLDYPVIGTDNNMIVIQEAGPMGWGPEKYAFLTPTYADAKALSIRTEAAFQALIPIELPLRWRIFVDTSNRFSFSLNCQFRLKMSASMAFIYGLVAASDGWITSPAIMSSGIANEKSVLSAQGDFRVESSVCDQMPVRMPFIHRVQNLPPGCRVRFWLRANNSMGHEYGDPSSLGAKSAECIEGWTESLLPPPPTNLRAEAVLSTAIVIHWDLPINDTGDPIENLEISWQRPDGAKAHFTIDAKREGYQVSGLTPGQAIRDICLRSINKNGVGPACADPIASCSSLASIPTRPYDFHVTETTRSSVRFEWNLPVYDGGAPIIEWEVAGFSPAGDAIKRTITAQHCTSFFMEVGVENENMGSWYLDFTVRCRNSMGWSPRSESANARTIDGPPRDADLMNVRMREQKRVHDAAVNLLRQAIALGTTAEKDAERAVRQPIRLKKALIEEAENTVHAAEEALIAAIDESEKARIKIIGAAQPSEDLDARMLLQRLRNKRGRRWGNRGKGLGV